MEHRSKASSVRGSYALDHHPEDESSEKEK
jgi:hypothetical protein